MFQARNVGLKMGQSMMKRSSTAAQQTLLKNGAGATTQVRNLNIHEYASMELMNQYGVPTPKGVMCTSAEQAEEVAKSGELGEEVVVKAQALTGGRGKGTFKNGFKGGVHIAANPAEAKDIAASMIGQVLVTKQTGEQGKPVDKVFLMEKADVAKEKYFSILMDRGSGGPVLVGSPDGGMNIEEVAEKTPERIFKEPIDIMEGLKPEQAQRLAKNMGFEGDAQQKAADTIAKLYDLFIASDSTLVEINPLAETSSGDVLCCDAKLNFDDNAEFRQEKIFGYRDQTQEDPREVAAAQYGLNYIGLDGTIGCLVNGAGLAMATMDIISLHGGSPANFLDVGGGATKSQVSQAFQILDADEKCKAILINIFGGIMRCDVIASGVIAAAEELGMKKPIVIRLQGTNVDEAKKIIADSGFDMVRTDDLDEAASIAVDIASKAA